MWKSGPLVLDTLQWRHNEHDGFQITGVLIAYWNICSGADQRKHQSSMLLAFMRGFHRWPLNSPHKGPVMQKIFLFGDLITICCINHWDSHSGHALTMQMCLDPKISCILCTNLIAESPAVYRLLIFFHYTILMIIMLQNTLYTLSLCILYSPHK